jgi:uncharacterized protein YqgC (DUF456 family)
MNLSDWIRETPLIAVFLGTMVIVLASIGAGFAVGNWRSKRLEEQGAGVVGSAIAAILGLLAFIEDVPLIVEKTTAIPGRIIKQPFVFRQALCLGRDALMPSVAQPSAGDL